MFEGFCDRISNKLIFPFTADLQGNSISLEIFKTGLACRDRILAWNQVGECIVAITIAERGECYVGADVFSRNRHARHDRTGSILHPAAYNGVSPLTK
jgi:hypothetical protein